MADPGLAIVELISHHHSGPHIYHLLPPREQPASSILVGDVHLLLVLRVSNKNFAYIFEGTNICTLSLGGISLTIVTLNSGFSRLGLHILGFPNLQNGLRQRGALAPLLLMSIGFGWCRTRARKTMVSGI